MQARPALNRRSENYGLLFLFPRCTWFERAAKLMLYNQGSGWKKRTRFWRKPALFRRQPSEVSRDQRMKFLAEKMSGGVENGKAAMYCRVLEV